MRKSAIVNLLSKDKGPRYKLDLDRTVKVYWNLHRKCFSVQQDGLVKAHLNRVYLHSVEFKVSEAGRQRVIKEQRKNVHAFAVGTMVDAYAVGTMEGKVDLWSLNPVKVSYNPYKSGTFVTGDGGSINFAPMACLENRQITAWL